MKVAALFSGGKDSVFAVYLAQSRGWTVERLITLMPVAGRSHMFHIPNIEMAGMLAQAMGIPHSSFPTEGVEEEELGDLKKALAGLDVESIVTGAIASDYQHTRIDRLCHELGMRSFSPLWRWKQGMVLEDMLAAGFSIMVVGVYAEGLGPEWLGRVLDTAALEELRALSGTRAINVSGEGGEFESLVLDGPNFRRRVEVLDTEKEWHGLSGEMLIRKAELREK